MVNESRAWTRHWAALWNELHLRTFEPLESPTFVIFFLSVVIGVGGVGVWVELIKFIGPKVTPEQFDGLLTSLITFCFALVGTSCTQLIIEESESKAMRALAQLVLILAFFGGALAIAVQSGLWIWTLASIAALLVWWIANSKSPGLRDTDATTGGDLTKTLPGNLSEYKIK